MQSVLKITDQEQNTRQGVIYDNEATFSYGISTMISQVECAVQLKSLLLAKIIACSLRTFRACN